MKFPQFGWHASAVILLLSFVIGCQPTTKTTDVTKVDNGRAIAAASLQGGPTLADLAGGELGKGGGFLIGAAPEKIQEHQQAQAVAAAQAAERSPAQIQEARSAKTADLNNDGFVTLDEILAMVRAGLSQQEIAERIKRTGYIFHITPEQERYLTDRGVTPDVISILRNYTSTAVAMREH